MFTSKPQSYPQKETNVSIRNAQSPVKKKVVISAKSAQITGKPNTKKEEGVNKVSKETQTIPSRTSKITSKSQNRESSRGVTNGKRGRTKERKNQSMKREKSQSKPKERSRKLSKPKKRGRKPGKTQGKAKRKQKKKEDIEDMANLLDFPTEDQEVRYLIQKEIKELKTRASEKKIIEHLESHFHEVNVDQVKEILKKLGEEGVLSSENVFKVVKEKKNLAKDKPPEKDKKGKGSERKEKRDEEVMPVEVKDKGSEKEAKESTGNEETVKKQERDEKQKNSVNKVTSGQPIKKDEGVMEEEEPKGDKERLKTDSEQEEKANEAAETKSTKKEKGSMKTTETKDSKRKIEEKEQGEKEDKVEDVTETDQKKDEEEFKEDKDREDKQPRDEMEEEQGKSQVKNDEEQEADMDRSLNQGSGDSSVPGFSGHAGYTGLAEKTKDPEKAVQPTTDIMQEPLKDDKLEVEGVTDVKIDEKDVETVNKLLADQMEEEGRRTNDNGLMELEGQKAILNRDWFDKLPQIDGNAETEAEPLDTEDYEPEKIKKIKGEQDQVGPVETQQAQNINIHEIFGSWKDFK